MRNRYSKILCLLLLFACCLPQEGNAFWPFKKKKKEDKKENLTPYQKLFKNKKVQTAHGLMTIHKVEGKVYVEFPVAMLASGLSSVFPVNPSLFTRYLAGLSCLRSARSFASI